jgi:hypothetical protein
VRHHIEFSQTDRKAQPAEEAMAGNAIGELRQRKAVLRCAEQDVAHAECNGASAEEFYF